MRFILDGRGIITIPFSKAVEYAYKKSAAFSACINEPGGINLIYLHKQDGKIRGLEDNKLYEQLKDELIDTIFISNEDETLYSYIVRFVNTEVYNKIDEYSN